MTYTIRTLLATLILAVSVAHSQSLEERALQARRLQTQSLQDADRATIDSLIRERERSGQGVRRGSLPGLPSRGPSPADTIIRDSLIAGPLLPGSDSDFADTAAADSATRAKRRLAKGQPRRYEQRIFRSANASAFSSATGMAGRDHVLGPGDEVTVFIWGDKENSYSLPLNSEGKIFLEGVGLVPVGGLDLNEAAKRLKERLARIYSGINRGTTHVDVSLGRAGPIKAFLLGEVAVPGGYVFSGNTSVLSALYFAKGPSDIGTVRNLQLTRGGRKYVLDLYQYLMRGENLSPASLQDGDILFAPRAEILVDVEGDVGRPAVYELKAGEGVKELLEFAGRPNPTAAHQRMVLQRIGAGGRLEYLDLEPPQQYLTGQAKTELRDGDRLLVHRSTDPDANYMNITGPVRYPGIYSSAGVANVRDLVAKAGGLREDAFLGRVHILRFRPDGSSRLFAYSLDSSLVDSIRLEPKDDVILYSLKDMYLPDSVEVAGAVFNPGKYEYREGMSALDLVVQAGGFLPNHETGKLLVFRGDDRDARVEPIQVSSGSGLSKGRESFPLKRNDLVHVPVDPRWYRKEVVTLEGLFMKPGKYALLHPGEKLASVIERSGGFKSNAYIEGGRFFRTKDSVGRVGVDIQRALAKPRSKANIGMVGGDSIYIPERFSTVKVMGEVGFETSVLYQEGQAVQYYIEKAGGFTRRSEKDRIVVQYANGETSRDGYFNRKPDAGSVIYVPQGPEPQSINWLGGINAILGTLGLAAALLLSIQAISN